MKINELKSITFPLSGGYYIIRRKGQDSPNISDDVIASCEFNLPVLDHQATDLSPILQFGNRLDFAHTCLHPTWGNYGGCEFGQLPTRVRILYFHHRAWAGAFEAAEVYAQQEFFKLEAYLAVRAKALVDADIDPSSTNLTK